MYNNNYNKIKYKSKETAIKVVLRMLADRKYKYINKIDNIVCYKKTEEYSQSESKKCEGDNSKCYLFLNIISKFSRSKLEEYMSVMESKKINHIIILYELIITAQAKKILNSQSDITIELFRIEDLVFNITDHYLVPKHTRLNPRSELYKDLFNKYGHKLSKMLIDDPVSKYYFYKLNDIIEIERKDGSITYRIVVKTN